MGLFDRQLEANVMTTKLDWVVNWARFHVEGGKYKWRY